MRKSEFVAAVAKEAGMSQRDTEKVIDALNPVIVKTCVEDGDEISLDVDSHMLHANLSEEVIEARREGFKEHKKHINSKWLKRYGLLVTNASSGAVLKTEL